VAAAAAQSLGLPPTVLQQTTPGVLPPSAMSAGGTPIILTPRLQTPAPAPQLAGITSLSNQAVLAGAPAHHTPANPTTVPTSGLVYSYDPSAYLQRMLEYSTSVEPSAIGKCLLVFIDIRWRRKICQVGKNAKFGAGNSRNVEYPSSEICSCLSENCNLLPISYFLTLPGELIKLIIEKPCLSENALFHIGNGS